MTSGSILRNTLHAARKLLYSLMKDLSVIGSLRLRTDFWDRHGANIATRWRGTHGERLFERPKRDFGER